MASRVPRSAGAFSKGGSSSSEASRKLHEGGARDLGKSDGRRLWTRGFLRWLISATLLAPLLAFVIQLVRAPDEEPAAGVSVKSRVIAPLIAGALANPRPTLLEFSLEEINAHLAQVLPAAGRKKDGLLFQKASVRLDAERCHFTALHHWRRLELHARVTYSVVLQGGRLHVKPMASSLGRVQFGMFWTRKIHEGMVVGLLPLLRKEQVLATRLETLRLENGRALLKVRASASAG